MSVVLVKSAPQQSRAVHDIILLRDNEKKDFVWVRVSV